MKDYNGQEEGVLLAEEGSVAATALASPLTVRWCTACSKVLELRSTSYDCTQASTCFVCTHVAGAGLAESSMQQQQQQQLHLQLQVLSYSLCSKTGLHTC
jgi:hypothetical protein